MPAAPSQAAKRKRWIAVGVIVSSLPLLIILSMVFGDMEPKVKDELELALSAGVFWSVVYWFVFWARWRGKK